VCLKRKGGVVDRKQRFFLLVVVLIGVAALIVLFSFAARGQELDPNTCQEEGTCWIPAGGEPQPLKGAVVGTPWKKTCASGDDWCPSIAAGVDSGVNWCSSDKCIKNHITGAYEIWDTWHPPIEEMCGGQPGMWPAQTMRTESFGDVFSMTTSGTKECGLASVDRVHAEKLNVNACDPMANIYATCWFRNKRLLVLREKLPDVTKAPLQDQWLLAGAGGAVGSGKVIALIQKSGALKTDKDGKLKHADPYDYLIRYMKGLHYRWEKAQKVYALKKKIGLPAALGKVGLTEKQWKYVDGHGDLYAKHGDWSSVFGFRPGRTAFRIARPGRVAEIMKYVYPEGIPWGQPELPVRPEGLYEYPGDKLHCACGNWEELKGKKPVVAEYEYWEDNLDPVPLVPEEALELAYGG
jgi:hypothetical protein